jgi:hypothetical protein
MTDVLTGGGSTGAMNEDGSAVSVDDRGDDDERRAVCVEGRGIYACDGRRNAARGTRHAVPGTRYLARGTRHAVPGTGYPARGTWHAESGTGYPARGTRHISPVATAFTTAIATATAGTRHAVPGTRHNHHGVHRGDRHGVRRHVRPGKRYPARGTRHAKSGTRYPARGTRHARARYARAAGRYDERGRYACDCKRRHRDSTDRAVVLR